MDQRMVFRKATVLVSAILLSCGESEAQWNIPFPDDAFMAALAKDNLVEATAFLERNPNVNMQHREGTTYLQAVSHWGQTNGVSLLLSKGAKVNSADIHGRTALHYAVIFNPCSMGGQIPIELQKAKMNACRLLLDSGADVNSRDADGNTPLHWVLRQTFIYPSPVVTLDICRLLVGKKVHVTATNDCGETALHLAAQYALTNVCAFLIAEGANPNAKDDAGRTPLHEAMFSSLAPPPPNLYEMKTVCDILLNAGADPNVQDRCGDTPLHFAVSQRYGVLCTVLIGKGANSVIRNNKGQTALAIAEEDKQQELVELLRRHMMKTSNKTSEPAGTSVSEVHR